MKNFSILRDVGRDDYSLSPNYDILYTGYHIKTESDIMGIELFDDIETKGFSAQAAKTVADNTVGGLQYGLGGAVVLLQAHGFYAAEVLAKALNIFYLCASPAVD